jgi:1-aminocyclopropane-1-carboxylate deaminase/D-cysteine desulfhydrase-like pyridoxal-dependent ACC family enzyme
LTTPHGAALARLAALPRLAAPPLAPTPIETLSRLRDALGPWTGSRRPFDLLVKRDDAIPFGFGGNKVRKLQLVAQQAILERADTLITCGGVQSNHMRATAATAVKTGLQAVLVANGSPSSKPTANALLDRLLGAEVRYVASREERALEMARAADELRANGRRPYVIPLGASTPLGAAAFALAVGEMLSQTGYAAPDTIVLSTSSGGTQAGVIAGCRLHGVATRVIGISADETSARLGAEVRRILEGLEDLLEIDRGVLSDAAIEIDDAFVGDGYGIPTPASIEAIEMSARLEALFLDPTYTSKAMAGLIARGRRGELDGSRVLFWHTGGQVGLFA